MKRAILISTLSVASLACAMLPNNPQPFDGVGRLGDPSGGTITTSGSGVAISPNWVLTAAHVGGSRFEQNGQIYTVVQTITHPTADIALKRVVGPVQSALPMKFNVFSGAVPTVQTNLPGTVMTLAGYGITGSATATGYTYDDGTQGTRRVGRNAMDLFIPNVPVDLGGGNIRTSNYIFYDLDDPAGVSPVNILGGPRVGTDEGGMSVFDSGCPWTVQENNRYRVVGIGGIVGTFSGTGVTRPYNWGGFGGAALLQSYQSWIQSTATDIGRAIIDAATFEIGGPLGGTITNIAESDNVYFSTRTNTAAFDSDTQLGFFVYGKTTADPGGTLRITLEGRSVARQSEVIFRMRNWVTNQYVQVGSGKMGKTDTTTIINGISGTNFINTDGRVELQIRVNPLTDDMRLYDAFFDVIRVDALP